jgi:predicted phage terminase large subunit-like protein
MIPKLTEVEKEVLRLQIESEIYKRSLYEFFIAATKVLYPQVQWDMNWHFRYICDILQAETERIGRNEVKTNDFIINLPFRSGKSILLSQIYPVWIWIVQPSAIIMQVSHSETLAIKHSHASKMLIDSEWFKKRFPEIILRVDTHAKANYMNTFGGKRISFGINSGIIGEGCNYQIIDDINNPQDSKAVTQTINETYTDTLYSRLNNSDVDIRVILQQRVSENDICGYLLNTNPDKYFHICVPAKLAPNVSPPELVNYYKDGLFWHDRFSHSKLLDFQQTLGARAYSGQLMQKPQAEMGTIIKRNWFKIIELQDLPKVKIQWNMYLDSAYTSSKKNDSSAIILAGKVGNILYVRKCWNLWLEFPELIVKLKEIQLSYGSRLIYIESKASGLSIIQQLRKDGFNVTDLKPRDKDKISRVNAVTPIMEGGRVILIEDTSNEMLLQEVSGFPFGKDNIVDALTYSIATELGSNAFSYGMT